LAEVFTIRVGITVKGFSFKGQGHIQSGPEEIAQSLLHRHFSTVYSIITQFSPKLSEEITVYQSMQNLYRLNIL